MKVNTIIQGDVLSVLKTFPSESIDCIITSPPYFGLRDYGVTGQIGLEPTLNEYINKLLLITAELKRVLKKSGTMFWNHGDSYSQSGGADSQYEKWHSKERLEDFKKYGGKRAKDFGMPEKCLMLQNFRLIQRMIDKQRWILRNVCIWYKPNVMPSSVKDRFSVDFEPVFFFVKNKKYWFEQQFEKYYAPMDRWGGQKLKAKGESEWDQRTGQSSYRDRDMRPNELGRNKRTVWKIPTQPYKEAHFATFPEKLIEPMIKAGCPEFICKKCEKAREKIISNLEWESHQTGRMAKLDIVGNPMFRGGHHNDGLPYKTERKEFIGYTDCGCNHSDGWNKGIVLDPFMGSGTTGLVAKKLGRNYLGIELNPDYIKIAKKRLAQDLLF